MMVKVIAIEPCDGRHPGEAWEVPARQAEELRAAGLVKMGVGPRENKMAPGPQENKQNPPAVAAGAVVQQSASPVAQASRKTTPQQSPTGKRRGRSPGRSSR